MYFNLRPWTIHDPDSLVKYANNFNIAKNVMDVFPHPYSADDGKVFIEMTNEKSPPDILAIEVNGEAAGAIGLHHGEKALLLVPSNKWWIMVSKPGTSPASHKKLYEMVHQ